ncbi:MAG TPA: hypothetical protein PK079_09610 [Leptospiraceae bacterium]|nr:hypothetical protein [Leptospiraceae bacterium]HMW04562.1 hypothetical protein [Leptospiraceae bacterium]HMX33443.1 hypothetical protein [Leptospiraceae bacterium]HMY30748.1 hypothetical protein [Leptospiraceae bacterium]HMZ64326.1 hypothetical protein [Leptospiraceae bacterium]
MNNIIKLFLMLSFTIALVAQSGIKPLPNDGKMDRAEKAIETIPTNSVDSLKTESKTTVTTTTTTTTTAAPAPVNSAPVVTQPPVSNARAIDPNLGNTPALYINSRTAFELVTGDDLSGVDYIEYKINDGEYSRYTVPISLSKEGPATITYKATDKVGNKETAKVINLIVDNTAPTVSVKVSEPLFTNGNTQYSSPKNTYQLIAEDKSSGVKQIVYSVDNEPKQDYKNEPIKLEKPGFHVINFYAIDNAGNVSQENSYIVNIDGIKPTVDIKESIPYIVIANKVYAKKETVFTITAADGQSGIKQVLVKTDGAPDFVPYVEPLTFGTSGEHIIEAKAIDNVGNESDIKRVVFSNDIKAPTTVIKAVSN